MSWINDEFWTNKKKEDKPKTEDKPKSEDKPKTEDKPKSEDKPKTEDKPKSRLDVSVRETILKRQGSYPKYKDDSERAMVNRKKKNEWAQNPINKCNVKLKRLEKMLKIAIDNNNQKNIDKYNKLIQDEKMILDYYIKNSK